MFFAMKRAVTLLLLFVSLGIAAELMRVTPRQLLDMQKNGVPVIDIRTAPEWRQTGIVPGAHTITFFDERGGYDVRAFLKALKSLGITETTPFILVCRSASRTRTVGRFLSEKMGYKKVYHLDGGMLRWMAERKPVAPYRP